MLKPIRLIFALLVMGPVMGPARAQDPGTVDDKTLPPIEHPTASTPARELFGRKTTPDPAAARSIGFYSRGCLAGAVALVSGRTIEWMDRRFAPARLAAAGQHGAALRLDPGGTAVPLAIPPWRRHGSRVTPSRTPRPKPSRDFGS